MSYTCTRGELETELFVVNFCAVWSVHESLLLQKLRNLLSKIFLNDGDFLIPHDETKIFFAGVFFFWYNSVNGVQPEC